jgi:hypothetical protein
MLFGGLLPETSVDGHGGEWRSGAEMVAQARNPANVAISSIECAVASGKSHACTMPAGSSYAPRWLVSSARLRAPAGRAALERCDEKLFVVVSQRCPITLSRLQTALA